MEDDEEALKEDEKRPRGTLGTEVRPMTPSKFTFSARYFALTSGVFGAARPLCDYLGQPPRGGPPALLAPLRLTETVTRRTARPLKTPPATAKD